MNNYGKRRTKKGNHVEDFKEERNKKGGGKIKIRDKMK